MIKMIKIEEKGKILPSSGYGEIKYKERNTEESFITEEQYKNIIAKETRAFFESLGGIEKWNAK